MNWNDIEAKWTAMTRRVQSDTSRDDDQMTIPRAAEQPPVLQDEPTEQRAPASVDSSST